MWLVTAYYFREIFHFYSHIPCGMWREDSGACRDWWHFYSHIPCGMWRVLTWHIPGYVAFLLTHPVWDVTFWFTILRKAVNISTHTSRVGCDVKCRGGLSGRITFLLTHPVWDVTPLAKSKTTKIHFYSHIPCGMWQYCDLHIKSFREFLLTHPVWDVTVLRFTYKVI